MTNAEEFKETLSRSLTLFQSNWDTLLSFQEGNIDPQLLISFQPELLKTLYALQTLYNSISAEIRELKRKIQIIKCKYYRLRIDSLSLWNHRLRSAIDIGKVIGDSFAWIFYQNQHKLLRKNRANAGSGVVPTRVGGQGEIEFIKNFPKFGDYLTLSHSITTFLHVGDVSLIDPNTLQIAGVAEIKSHRISFEELHSTITLVGANMETSKLPQAGSESASKAHNAEWPDAAHAQQRFERQIGKMRELLEAEKDARKTSKSMQLDGVYPIIETLCKKALVSERKHASEALHKGLLLTTFDLGERDWLSKDNITSIKESGCFEEVIQQAKLLCKEGSHLNSIFIGWVLYPSSGAYQLAYGMRPLFWWPMESEVRKRIIFKDLAIMTMYNPAFLLHELIDLGFDVAVSKKGEISIERKFNGGVATFIGVNEILESAQTHLFTDQHLVQIFRGIAEFVDTEKLSYGYRLKLDLRFIYN